MTPQEIKTAFLETGEIPDRETLRKGAAALEGPDYILCRRLLSIAEGNPQTDAWTNDLLTRRNASLLHSSLTVVAGCKPEGTDRGQNTSAAPCFRSGPACIVSANSLG